MPVSLTKINRQNLLEYNRISVEYAQTGSGITIDKTIQAELIEKSPS